MTKYHPATYIHEIIQNNPEGALEAAKNSGIIVQDHDQLSAFIIEKYQRGEHGQVKAFLRQIPFVNRGDDFSDWVNSYKDSFNGSLNLTEKGVQKDGQGNKRFLNVIGDVLTIAGGVLSPQETPPPPPPPAQKDNFFQKNMIWFIVGGVLVLGGIVFVTTRKPKK